MSDSSYLSRLSGWFARSFLRPRWGARRALGSFMQSGSTWGAWTNTWTDSRYEQVRHYKHWVYIAVDRRATEVAMHAPNVSLVRDSMREPMTKHKWLAEHITRKALTPLMAHERLEPVPAQHPLVRLLDDPNEPDTSYDLWYETVMYLDLCGSAYWWVPSNPKTLKPAAIWVLPSHWVQPHINREGQLDWFDLYPVEGNYCRARIPANDVIVFRKKSPISKIDGYSTQTALNQWIDSEEAASKCLWFSFRNGIFPGVTIEFDANAKLPDESDLNRIESRLISRYGGEHNANRPMFVPPGARVKKLQLTPDELGCFTSIEAMRDHILAGFKVPPACVGLVKNMTYGSVQASRVELYNAAINPLFHYFGQNVTEKLAKPRYDKRLLCWWEDRTPQDPELLEKVLMTDHVYGSRTINEVRSIRGLEAIAEGWANEPWLPLNARPVSVLLSTPPDDTSGGTPGPTISSSSDPSNSPRLHDDNLHVNG